MGETPERPSAFTFAFRWIAEIGVRRPWLVLAVVGVIAALSAYAAHDMPVSTSRYKLVSASDNPLQAQLVRFFERFGYPDALVLVISGSTPAEQQRVSREICAELDRQPEFHDRLLCRIGARQMAEVALLFEPAALAEVGKRFGADTPLAALVEGGLPAWIGAAERQISAGLEGKDDKAKPEDADKGLRGLASAIRALDAELRGADAMSELPASAAGGPEGGIRLDDKGFLVGADGSYRVIALFPQLPGTEGLEIKPFVDKIRAARDKVQLGDVHADLTGMPAVVVDELDSVERGFKQSSGATFAGILFLLLIGYRSLRYSIFALVPLAVGTVASLAFARVAFGGTNLITAGFASVLMGIGSDFAIIMLGRYSEQLRSGEDRRTAIRSALVLCGPGTLIAAASTIVAFLMLTTTTFTAYAQLGILVAVGLAAMVLFTLFLLPPITELLNKKEVRAAEHFVGMGLLPPLVRKGRLAILALGLLLVAGASALALRVKFNARYFDFLPTGAESVRGLALIESDESVSPLVANVPTDDVEEARALAAALRKQPSIGSVETATDLLPELGPKRLADLRAGLAALGPRPHFDTLRTRPTRDAKEVLVKVKALYDTLDEVGFALKGAGKPTAAVDEVKGAVKALQKTLEGLPDGGKPALEALERTVADLLERAWTTAANVAKRGAYASSDLPPVFRARFAAKDGNGLALYVMPKGNVWAGDAAKRFHDDVLAVAPAASGLALEIHSHQTDILRSFTRAAILTGVLMFFTCLLSLRSLRDALLAMVPVLVGFALMMGFMAAVKFDLNVANIVALPQLMGISVELGSQIVLRAQQSAAERGGRAELGDVLQGTGSSIIIAAGTTILGFAALTLADYRAMKSLGLIMTVGTGSTLLASLLFLPALLVLSKRAE